MNVRKLSALVAALVACLAGSVASIAQAPTAKKPRVFFVEPKDGATVTSPLHMKFGAEGIEIGAVPPGDIKTARPGIAHYHIGFEQDCLAAGQNIVKGTPSWVHFGDGKAEFDTQLTPGKHKFALQLGDDLHNTLPGTCTAITVTVK